MFLSVKSLRRRKVRDEETDTRNDLNHTGILRRYNGSRLN